MDISLYNKTITRLPESMMFSFQPLIDSMYGNPNFEMKIMDSKINFNDVLLNGSQYQVIHIFIFWYFVFVSQKKTCMIASI